jgi:hypothetical protein
MYKDDGVEKLSEKTGDVAFVIQSLSKKKKKKKMCLIAK